MLVLSRCIGEELVIGGNVRVVVVSQNGGKTRLGVEAPDDVVVDRGEVHQRKLAQSRPVEGAKDPAA